MSLKTRIVALERAINDPAPAENVIEIRQIIVHSYEEAKTLRESKLLVGLADPLPRGPIAITIGETFDAAEILERTEHKA